MHLVSFYQCQPQYLFFSSSLREDGEACAYDNQSSSIIRLTNGTILYLREVNRSVKVLNHISLLKSVSGKSVIVCSSTIQNFC